VVAFCFSVDWFERTLHTRFMKMISTLSVSLVLGSVFTVHAAPERASCIKELKPYEKASSAEEQFQAGKTLLKHDCPNEAVTLWEKAAKAHHAGSLFMLGILHQGGDRGVGNVRADPEKAFPYFVESAERGNADAMHMVAMHYEFGSHFMKPDFDKAWTWYLKAAKAGSADARQRIKTAYEKGELGQATSVEKAKNWKSK
jgi:TPR repeat protein